EESLALAKRQRRRLFDQAGVSAERTVEALDAILSQKSKQRSALMETSERLNRRYGELKQLLSRAEEEREFDEIKLECEQVRTRMEESACDYARLLLARRMLEAAIAAWE